MVILIQINKIMKQILKMCVINNNIIIHLGNYYMKMTNYSRMMHFKIRKKILKLINQAMMKV